MKKTQVFIISFLFLISNVQASLFQAPNPYSFGPEGRTVADLRDFAKPNQMVSILPNRPVVATDSEGNRVYYTPDGKMTLTIAKDGSMSFSLGGVTKQTDSSGNLTRVTSYIKNGNGLCEIKNEFGEVLGYKALDGEGNTAVEYDKDMNKLRTYNYGEFGKTISYVVDEMTKNKTVYDQYGREMAVFDVDGYILATYQYEDVAYEYGDDRKTVVKVQSSKDNSGEGLLVSRKDYQLSLDSTDGYASEADYGTVFTTTFFDKEGLIVNVKDSYGVITTAYFYKSDDKGNKILDYVLDTETKNKTYYDENGRQTYTANAEDGVIRKYYWEGSKMLYIAEIASDGSWSKTTKDGVTTYGNIVYNEDGTINTIADESGNVSKRYFYKTDENNNTVLDYVEDVQNKTKTYYDSDGKEIETRNEKGEVITDYSWNNDNLVYSFDRETGITKWYNGDKEVVYESLNENIITKNIYSFGQLVGVWDAQQSTVTILINERNWITLRMDEEPSVDTITKIITNSKYVNETLEIDSEGFGWGDLSVILPKS